MGERPWKGSAYHKLEARISELERERDEARAYAQEGWDWLAEALDILGVRDVFEMREKGNPAEATIQRVREEVERWPKKFGHTQRILDLLSQESETP